MLIRSTDPDTPAPSEITPQQTYINRRQFMAISAASLMLPSFTQAALRTQASPYRTQEKANTLDEVTHYNNFYEFGVDKTDPAAHAASLQTRPWSIKIEGQVKAPRTFALDDILKLAPLEERIYRLRCVEGWSMVIPWVGFPLSALLKQVQPMGNAKFVEFISLADPKQMPGVRSQVLNWPYREGLRIDEVMHPLTLLTVGLYGDVLPKQNGAPIRIIVPWKYGFKSAKSIVGIRLLEHAPQTSWMQAGPSEYGFYSNVNPEVDHPRWSQATERRIGEFFKRKTLMFNGYGAQVAQLYSGMNLRINF